MTITRRPGVLFCGCRVSCVAPLAAPGAPIASGCYDGVVRLWDPSEAGNSAEPSSSFPAHKGAIKAAAAVRSGSGQLLLTAGADMVGRVWRGVGAPGTEQPEAVAVLRGHGESIEAVAVSASGDWAATGGWDSKLLLWRSGKCC